jgi:Ca-activated chloride channel family protein
MAKTRIRMLDADMGGTNIASAIEAALQIRSPIDMPADLLLITDGNVWDHETSVSAARRSGHRIFTVGVGSAVTESYVRGLAEETGGACELVSPNEDMADKIHRHFLRINSPRCEDMEVCWDNMPTRAFPEKTRCVYDGDTVHLFHWFDDAPTGEVTIKLNLPDGRVVSNVIALQMAETQKDTSSAHDLARVAAATIIRNVVDAGVGAKLALDYQLMSEWTNYLVTEQSDSGDKALQLPELRKVRSQVSAGWGGSSSLRMMSMDVLSVTVRKSVSVERKHSRDQSFHSDDLVAFLVEDDSRPYEDLIAKIKNLIASKHGEPIVSLALADLELQDTMEDSLRDLINGGLAESLVVAAFLNYFVLGIGSGSGSFSRQESRLLRKLYRAELAKSGLDAATIGQRIQDALMFEPDWSDVVAKDHGNAAVTC